MMWGLVLLLQFSGPLWVTHETGIYREISQLDVAIQNDVVFVLDGEGHQVLKYKSGQQVLAFGGRGQGPTDFNVPSHVWIFNDQVFVQSSDKVSCFDFQGQFIKSWKLPERGLDVGPIRHGDDWMWISKDSPIFLFGEPVSLKVWDKDLKEGVLLESWKEKPLISVHSREVNLEPDRSLLRFSPDFSKAFVRLPGDPLVLVVSDRIEGSITWQPNLLPFDKEQAQKRLDNINKRTNVTYTSEFPEYYPEVVNLRVFEGLLAVRLFKTSNKFYFKWFDFKGNPVPAPFTYDKAVGLLKFDQQFVYLAQQIDDEWVVAKHKRTH